MTRDWPAQIRSVLSARGQWQYVRRLPSRQVVAAMGAGIATLALALVVTYSPALAMVTD